MRRICIHSTRDETKKLATREAIWWDPSDPQTSAWTRIGHG